MQSPSRFWNSCTSKCGSSVLPRTVPSSRGGTIQTTATKLVANLACRSPGHLAQAQARAAAPPCPRLLCPRFLCPKIPRPAAWHELVAGSVRCCATRCPGMKEEASPSRLCCLQASYLGLSKFGLVFLIITYVASTFFDRLLPNRLLDTLWMLCPLFFQYCCVCAWRGFLASSLVHSQHDGIYQQSFPAYEVCVAGGAWGWMPNDLERTD